MAAALVSVVLECCLGGVAGCVAPAARNPSPHSYLGAVRCVARTAPMKVDHLMRGTSWKTIYKK